MMEQPKLASSGHGLCDGGYELPTAVFVILEASATRNAWDESILRRLGAIVSLC